jgi:hypothetical protein
LWSQSRSGLWSGLWSRSRSGEQGATESISSMSPKERAKLLLETLASL